MSELEICQFAYEGNIQQIINKTKETPTLLHKTDQSGRQAIHWACSGGHANVVEWIYENSSELSIDVRDESNWSPLMIAVSAGREQITKYLISKDAQVNAVNNNGQCSLHYAASKDRYEIAEILLQNESLVNVGDHFNNTPLHRASSKGHLKMVKLLLSYNADPNFQDSTGGTPLHMACEEEQVEVAKLLVENAASLSIRNKEEKTALELAPPGLRRQLRNLSNTENIMDFAP